MKIIEENYKWARTNWTIQKPDTIDIHHALCPTCTAQDVHKWHLANGWKGIAYHYFVRKDVLFIEADKKITRAEACKAVRTKIK